MYNGDIGVDADNLEERLSGERTSRAPTKPAAFRLEECTGLRDGVCCFSMFEVSWPFQYNPAIISKHGLRTGKRPIAESELPDMEFLGWANPPREVFNCRRIGLPSDTTDCADASGVGISSSPSKMSRR
jgi:hypothetical protein